MRKVISPATHAIITYSQNKEDIILASLFKDVSDGIYVDVGAAHPDYMSVTKAFYQRGWHGVNIEPNERLAALIAKVRPRDKTYRVAVSDHETRVSYREYLGDGLSTISADMKTVYGHIDQPTHQYYHDYDVPTEPLSTIFKKAGLKEIHFMKVDVEGAESQVIKSNDWSIFRPHVLCIDAVHSDGEYRDILTGAGYRQIFHDGLNEYYADSVYYQELPVVDYNYIYGTNILSAEWSERIGALRKENRQLIEDIRTLQANLGGRPTVDGEGLRFRAIAKVVLKKLDAFVTGKILPKPHEELPSGSTYDAGDREGYDKSVWSAMTESRDISLHRRVTLKGYRLGKRAVKKAAKVAKKGVKR